MPPIGQMQPCRDGAMDGRASQCRISAQDLPSAAAAPHATDLIQLLAAAEQRISGLDETFRDLGGCLMDLRDRLAHGRFHLAVLGQFKRGKSTLLNALIGDAVLPTSVAPLTAIPTFIRAGQTLSVRVLFDDDREPQCADAQSIGRVADLLSAVVTETGNPKNTLGVAQVEVTHPASILDQGVVLIDTPGIGSTFRHNTEATLNFLSKCDAALFLVSADPPITEVEVAFLRHVRSKVPRLFFILNKVDYLCHDDRRVAVDFLRSVLTEQAGVPNDAPLFCVSARQGLESRLRQDAALWDASGMAQVERHLAGFLAQEKAAALREAVARKASDVMAEALMRLRLALHSLRMPLLDLHERLGQFESKIDEAQKQRQAAGDLLAGDRRRMHEYLEQHAEELRVNARAHLSEIVRVELARIGASGEQPVQDAIAEAIPGFFERHNGQTTNLFRTQMANALRPHQERADRLIASIRKTAAELFDVPYHAPEAGDAFEIVQQPYWVTHKWSSTLAPIPVGLIDRLAPVALRRRRVSQRLLAQVESLVLHNVENLRWATLQTIDHTFIHFGSSLDQLLNDTITATHGAIRAALTRRQSQGATVATETARLEADIAAVEQMRLELNGRITLCQENVSSPILPPGRKSSGPLYSEGRTANAS